MSLSGAFVRTGMLRNAFFTDRQSPYGRLHLKSGVSPVPVLYSFRHILVFQFHSCRKYPHLADTPLLTFVGAAERKNQIKIEL